MTSFGLASSESLVPGVCLLNSGSFKCRGCIEEFGVNLRSIETRVAIDWDAITKASGQAYEDIKGYQSSNILEQFISFILELSSDWWGSELAVSADDATALATISAIVPIVGNNGASARNAKKLLRRSYSSAKQLADDQVFGKKEPLTEYDVYDILTEEHFLDALALVSALRPEARAKVTFCFRTDFLRPTICHLHNGSLHRHVHNWKRKGFALLLKVKNLLSLRAQSARSSSRLMNKFTHKLREVYLQLPEINSLLESGLYSRGYIEQEIDEVYSTVTDSVIRGFQSLKL